MDVMEAREELEEASTEEDVEKVKESNGGELWRRRARVPKAC
jgi:hypothetical protein